MTTIAQEIPRIRVQAGDLASRALTEQGSAEAIQAAWDASLGIQKRLEGEQIVIYARDRDGEMRRMDIHDRPGGYYALTYTDTDNDTERVYTTRVTGRYVDMLPISDYVGPHIDWKRHRESVRPSSTTGRSSRRERP